MKEIEEFKTLWLTLSKRDREQFQRALIFAKVPPVRTDEKGLYVFEEKSQIMQAILSSLIIAANYPEDAEDAKTFLLKVKAMNENAIDKVVRGFRESLIELATPCGHC